MGEALVLDALLITTLATSLLLGGVWLASRGRSSGLQRQIFAYGLLTCFLVFPVLLLARPDPLGCLTAPCAAGEAGAVAKGQVQRQYTLSAAGKWSGRDAVTSAGSVDAADRSRAPGRAALLLWGAGAGLLVLVAARRRIAAAALIREASPLSDPRIEGLAADIGSRLGIRTAIRLVHHPRLDRPFVCGLWRPSIFLPAGFERADRDEVEMVLLHELAHVRRRDALATGLCEAATCLLWFHPLVWTAARRMRDLQEMTADSQVLEQGIRPSRYAEYLVAAFQELREQSTRAPAGLHGILGGCLLERRLRSILDPGARHGVPGRAASLALAAGFFAIGALIASAPRALVAAGFVSQDPSGQAAIVPAERFNHETLDAVIRPVFVDKLADFYVAGGSIAVVHGGEIVYSEGFGDREVYSEDPVEPDRTIFRFGSITKAFTGAAVLQLVDEGRIDLDADVNQYLSGIEVPEAFGEPVRVHHLLTHTAGFDQIGLGRHADSRAGVRPLRDFLSENLIRIRPPGSYSTYDTYGITLAGLLVEQVSGLPYHEFLEQRLFQPLAMHRSSIVIDPALRDDVALGYGFTGSWEPARWEFMNTDPASTANGTVEDLARFGLMLLEGGELDGARVLSESSARAMLTRQHTNHPDHPGYSFTLWEDTSFGVPAFSHGGSMTGFAALLYLVPDHDFGVAITYNQESPRLANAVLGQLLGALFPDELREPEMRSRYEGRLDLGRFTGSYANSMHHHTDPETGWRRRPFEIERGEEGRLLFQGAEAFPVGPLTFQRADGLLLSFHEDADGRIDLLFVNQAVYERLP